MSFMVNGVGDVTELVICAEQVAANKNERAITEIYLMRQILEIQFFLSNLDEIKIPCMKRFLFFLLLSIVALSSFNACNKCYECDFGKNGVKELCSKDFPDGTSGLKLSVEAYEKQGYKCVQK